MIRNKNYKEIANSIRALSIDAIQKAKSGHPGMPLGMADIAAVFISDFFKFVPDWVNRDRLILSNGHGSMLLYSILYLMGYIDIEDLKQFRQLGSRAPGHPEIGITPGVEMSTGPLGQGIASAVGIAIAERKLNTHFGNIIDHKTYVFVGDGCLMEGISHEACSLAGHLCLNKLIVIFDNNGISIDGKISITSSDDTKKRFLSCNWNVVEADGHDYDDVKRAFTEALSSTKPVLISFKTIIGKSIASREGKSSAHSGPFKQEEVDLMKESLSVFESEFSVPANVLDSVRAIVSNLRAQESAWKEKAIIEKKYDLIQDFFRISINNDTEKAFTNLKNTLLTKLPLEATRVSFANALAEINLKNLVGGSADLTPSNGTRPNSFSVITRDDFSGSYIHYGIREHAMAACMNGFALYGCFLPYGGTFLVFSDYLRPSLRLAALMKLHVIYVFTHDSIGVGEDGPTHQPVEHIASLRMMPDVYTFRPADAIEATECWYLSLQIKAPIVLVLSRQGVQCIERDELMKSKNMSMYGAYILRDAAKDRAIDVTLIATGSEVGLAYNVQSQLLSFGINVRLVSFPCHRLFDKQSQAYKDELLENDSLKVVIEAGVSFGWDRYVGRNCKYFCVEDFGFSAPAEDLYKHFGLTVNNITLSIRETLGK